MNSVDETLDDLMGYLKEDDSKARKYVVKYLRGWDSSNEIDIIIISLVAELIQSFLVEMRKSFDESKGADLLYPELENIAIRALNDVALQIKKNL